MGVDEVRVMGGNKGKGRDRVDYIWPAAPPHVLPGGPGLAVLVILALPLVQALLRMLEH